MLGQSTFLAFAALAAAQPVAIEGFGSPGNDRFMSEHYPVDARAKGQAGTVSYEAAIGRDGVLTRCTVTRSSGFRELDNGTCDAMVRYGRFHPRRDDRGRAIASIQTGTVVWRLPANVAAAEADTIEVAAYSNRSDELICKRSTKVGSQIVKVRQCLTRSDWSKADDAARALGIFLTSPGGGAPGIY